MKSTQCIVVSGGEYVLNVEQHERFHMQFAKCEVENTHNKSIYYILEINFLMFLVKKWSMHCTSPKIFKMQRKTPKKAAQSKAVQNLK